MVQWSLIFAKTQICWKLKVFFKGASLVNGKKTIGRKLFILLALIALPVLFLMWSNICCNVFQFGTETYNFEENLTMSTEKIQIWKKSETFSMHILNILKYFLLWTKFPPKNFSWFRKHWKETICFGFSSQNWSNGWCAWLGRKIAFTPILLSGEKVSQTTSLIWLQIFHWIICSDTILSHLEDQWPKNRKKRALKCVLFPRFFRLWLSLWVVIYVSLCTMLD